MKEKKVFYSEAAYGLGVLLLALGTGFMERADFGLSMVVVPAYLLHLEISQFFPFFTFGMAEYCLQAVVLILLSLGLKRFKWAYLLSFVTALLYGFALDGAMALLGRLPSLGLIGRFLDYALGLLLCAAGISFLFHTYIPPEAYELAVQEIAARTGRDIHLVKTAYDCCSCLVGVVLSFAFFGFGHFEGVKLGTILCALVNGFLISRCSKVLEAAFVFQDAFPLRQKLRA